MHGLVFKRGVENNMMNVTWKPEESVLYMPWRNEGDYLMQREQVKDSQINSWESVTVKGFMIHILVEKMEEK